MSQSVPNVRLYTVAKAYGGDELLHLASPKYKHRARCDTQRLMGYGGSVRVRTLDFEGMCPICHSMALLDT